MATITVTNTRDSGAGSLRDAITRAQAGDTIKFASTLANTTVTLTSGKLTIDKPLTVDGTGVANLTISGNQASQVFLVPRSGTATFRNLTIANGRTTGSGGGIQAGDYSTLVVTNCRFINNAAGVGGGISFGYGTKATVTNSQFDRNDGTLTKSGFSAGAIATYGSSVLTVRGSQFTNNKGVNGGAIYSLLGALTIEDSVFQRNSSAGGIGGGAVFTDGANPVGPGSRDTGTSVSGTIAIRRSRFESNTALGEGGALFLYAYGPDKIILEDSTIVGNSVTTNGQYARGGGIRSSSNLTLQNVTVANNAATKQGGGLWIDGALPVNIINSTFSGNKVTDDAGGAMFLNTTAATPVNITNTTIANNVAGRASGAMWLGSSTQAVTLKNSIVANNTAGDRYQQQIGYAPRDGGGNIEFPPPAYGNRRVAATSQMVDPKLGALQTINGALLHPLLSGSPAINMGVTGSPTIDQRGFLRDTRPDIGAFEFGSSTRPTPTPALSIDSSTGLEGNSGTTNQTFTVRLSTASSQTITINYATANGNAKAGADYISKSGQLIFNAGETIKTLQIPIIGDLIPELSEVFYVNLSNASSAKILDAQGMGIIPTDDGLPPSLSINDVSVTEGSSGTINASFTARLSGTSPGRISVNYATENNTAIAGLDYTRVSGTLTFNPGETTKTFAVPILRDSLLESNETFTVRLTNPDNARIGDGTGIGTIVNNSTSSTTLATTSQVDGSGGTWYMNDLVQTSDKTLVSGTGTTSTSPIVSSSGSSLI